MESPRSSATISSSSSIASAVALLGRPQVLRSESCDLAQWKAIFLLILAFVLIASMSGGLIFGSAPFQAALVKQGYSVEDAKTIWGCGFEIFVVGTAVSSPLLDYVGPRWFGTLGLAVECVGHHLLARIGSYQQGRQFLAVGFGMIGMGGNMLMLASIQFSALFVNSSTIAAMMSGAYQFAGFIFIILNEPFIKFDVFFVVYEVITAFGMCLVFVCYPNQPYTSPHTARCSWPSMP